MTGTFVEEVDEAAFGAAVCGTDKLVLVDFSSDLCKPCNLLLPTLEKIGAESQDWLKIVRVETLDSDLAEAFNMKGIPTLMTMKNGVALDELHGLRGEGTIRAFLNQSREMAEKLPPAPPGTQCPVFSPPKHIT